MQTCNNCLGPFARLDAVLGDEQFFKNDSMFSLKHTRFTEKNRNLKYLGFSENAKITSAKPVCKNDSRFDKSNHRLYILNVFSNIYKLFTNHKLLHHANEVFSDFVSSCRTKYGSNHMILMLTENWKVEMDNRHFAGAVFKDVSVCLAA